MNLADLTQIAMLGTERQTVQVAKGKDSLHSLLAQLDLNRREPALLAAAALTATHERVGTLPIRDEPTLPAVCAAETLQPLAAAPGALLRRLLEGEHGVLLPECLQLVARASQIAPPELLPSLLAAGVNDAELRNLILPVLGRRGAWLAAQNPEWTWVVAGGEANEGIWQTGEKDARFVFFRQLRTAEPQRARDLLQGTWNEETPVDRAAFMLDFAIGLSEADEAFLEAALDDKRKEVRKAAAALLVRLPESAFARRMTERVRSLLKFTPGVSGSVAKLKRGKKAALDVTLPRECDKAMQRDGIEAKPSDGFGEKAWWLIQMLESAPLSVWTREWNVDATELFAASQVGEWKKEFFEAWTRAAVRQRNGEWADVLLGAAVECERFDKVQILLSVMSPPQQETHLTQLLRADQKKAHALSGSLLEQCQHEWTPAFSRAVLAAMRRETAQRSGDWVFRNQLKHFAAFLHPSVLGEAADRWPTDSPDWEFWAPGVDEFLEVAQVRAQLHAALPSPERAL